MGLHFSTHVPVLMALTWGEAAVFGIGALLAVLWFGGIAMLWIGGVGEAQSKFYPGILLMAIAFGGEIPFLVGIQSTATATLTTPRSEIVGDLVNHQRSTLGLPPLPVQVLSHVPPSRIIDSVVTRTPVSLQGWTLIDAVVAPAQWSWSVTRPPGFGSVWASPQAEGHALEATDLYHMTQSLDTPSLSELFHPATPDVGVNVVPLTSGEHTTLQEVFHSSVHWHTRSSAMALYLIWIHSGSHVQSR